MHAKRPRQISRSTSMSRLHSCTLPKNPSEKPGPRGAPAPAPAIDGRCGFQVSHESTAPPVLLHFNGIAEARREPTSPSPKNEHFHEKLQLSEQYVISVVQDEMDEGGQLLDSEMESDLLPPSEPSHFAVQIGLYSVLEPRMKALSVDSTRVEAASRESKETDRIECSSWCAPLLEIDSAANEGAVDSRPLADFLDECSICKRQLGHGSDTYMYRGERAFCSMECRHYEILMEERSDQFFLTAFKKATPTHKRKIIANSSTTTCV